MIWDEQSPEQGPCLEMTRLTKTKHVSVQRQKPVSVHVFGRVCRDKGFVSVSLWFYVQFLWSLLGPEQGPDEHMNVQVAWV